MIHTLELTNYRGFERYKLSNLARVNLLVGQNNSGKTSILEAVQLLATGAFSEQLTKLARRRGEFASGPPDLVTKQARFHPDVRHLFHGRMFEEGSIFSLSADGDLGSVTIRVVRQEDGYKELQGVSLDTISAFSGLGLLSEYRLPGSSSPGPTSTVPITDDGNALFHRPRPYGWSSNATRDGRPVRFIPQGSLDRDSMNEMWNHLLMEGQEQAVLKALQILDPKIASIAFLSNPPAEGRESRSGIYIGFEKEQRRSPLGSEGEGTRRLLALALALADARNGFLLIDEIDTGLHYSILGDVWLLIVETAMRYNIQVFLTTHSYDCVRALSWLCGTHPDLGSEVSIQKVERAIDEAVSLDAEQIQIAVEQDIEVR